jgi:hypothetical protein
LARCISVFAVGIALQGSTANVLTLNLADPGLRLVSATLLVAVGLAADRGAAVPAYMRR